MHYVQAKGILSNRCGMNLYRGCEHGCIYCDSRSRCYGMDHAFEDIAVKENASLLLERALRSRRQPCMIGTGAMTDPYIPLEQQLGLTRSALGLIDKYGFGVAIQTKSDGILRDMDLLQSIHSKTKAVVQMTMTTADEALCAIIEPNVCTTKRRYEVLKAFQAAEIPTVVWLSPILPFLNDTPENIRLLLEYCLDAGVKGVLCFGMGVTLREGNREYFYRALDAHFPGLKQQYIRTYANAYVLASPYQSRLLRQFHETCERYGLWHDNGQIFRYLAQFERREAQTQLSLF